VETQNAFAGQGPVVLDIGGDIGALVVEMPAALDAVEVEIRPVASATGTTSTAAIAAPHSHDSHPHGSPEPGHGHSHAHPHVAVVARPTGAGQLPSLVFGELSAGDYELYERTDGRVRLYATVRGGEVTEASWPV
jgi:hypothetical protein